jgi:hypothetical protein
MRASSLGHGEKKSRKAEQFIAALLTHPTIEAATKAVGISEATAWRWMKNPEFAAHYREARREAMRHTTARLQEAAREAVECLREVQRTGESESARVSAARTILEQALKAVDLEDVQQRLDELERAVKPQDERNSRP